MGNIGYYVLRRFLQSIFILWTITVIAFTIMHLAPGSPVTILDNPDADPADIAAINRSYGLEDPILLQYVRWLGRVLQGDLGRSFADSRPVAIKIGEKLPATLTLAFAARIIGLWGIPLGIYAALKRASWLDHLIRWFTAIGSSAPHWWIGLMVLVFIASPTRLFPLGGMYDIGRQDDLANRLQHIVLPALTFALGDLILWTRFVRSSLLDVLHQDYVRTAYAKGMKQSTVLWRHVFRNAMIPVITVLGGWPAMLVTGSVLIETTFSWPGIGRLTYTSALQRDYPVVMGLLIISSSLVLIGNLVVDVTYRLVDPRVQLL